MPPSPSAPLQHTRRMATRDLIQDAALDLFETKGYRATTVDDIAERVGISARTYFRYFPTKEAVLVFWQRDAGEHLAAVELTPGGPVDVLLQLHACMDAFIEAHAAGDPQVVDRFRRAGRIVAANPELHSAELMQLELLGTTVLDAVTTALGPQADDLLPTLVAHLFGAMMTSALDNWCAQDASGTTADLLDLHRRTRAAVESMTSR